MDSSLLQSVLWDIDQEKVALLPDTFVIRRVLSYGTVRLLFQAIAHYGHAAVAAEFSKLARSSMDARRYHYLAQFVFAGRSHTSAS